jgi:P27 family predicted phage terminase small subunit
MPPKRTKPKLAPVRDRDDAPEHLSERSQGLWNELHRSFLLEATEAELLRLGLEALDRTEEARAVLAEEGTFTTNRYGNRVTHPAVSVERDSRLAAVRIFRELGLENATEISAPLALRRRRR